MPKFLSNIDLNNSARVINVPIPKNANDVVNKAYIDAEIDKAISGLKFQKDVKNVQKNNELDPGATPAKGDRYIITDASNLHQNFTDNISADTTVTNGDVIEYNGEKFVLATDIETSQDGLIVFVTDLDQYYKCINTVWSYGGMSVVGAGSGLKNNEGVFEVDFDNVSLGLNDDGKLIVKDQGITAAKLASDIFGKGLMQDATSKAIMLKLAENGGLEFDATTGELKVATGGGTVGTVRSFAADITAGKASYDIAHNLNTKDVVIQVVSKATGDHIIVDNTRKDINTATISFAEELTADCRVIVLGTPDPEPEPTPPVETVAPTTIDTEPYLSSISYRRPESYKLTTDSPSAITYSIKEGSRLPTGYTLVGDTISGYATIKEDVSTIIVASTVDGKTFEKTLEFFCNPVSIDYKLPANSIEIIAGEAANINVVTLCSVKADVADEFKDQYTLTYEAAPGQTPPFGLTINADGTITGTGTGTTGETKQIHVKATITNKTDSNDTGSTYIRFNLVLNPKVGS